MFDTTSLLYWICGAAGTLSVAGCYSLVRQYWDSRFGPNGYHAKLWNDAFGPGGKWAKKYEALGMSYTPEPYDSSDSELPTLISVLIGINAGVAFFAGPVGGLLYGGVFVILLRTLR